MDDPLVRFYQLVPGGRPPRRATKDIAGTLPAAAVRFCQPVLDATSYGYNVFLTFGIGLRWDGASCLEWSYDCDGTGIGAEWWPLLPECHYPGFAEYWANNAPAHLREDVPPFIVMTEDYGMVQIWPGCLARTREEWSLLVRGPTNDARRSLGYEVMEGIISTDRWGGPLPVMLRLLKSDIEIVLMANRPFAQVVPVYRPHFDYRLLDQFTVGDFADVPPERWQSYAEWAARVTGPHRPGEYTAAERRRWAGKT